MRAHMDFKSSGARIGFATSIKRTNKRSVACMNKFMRIKMSFSDEAFLTFCAGKGSGTSMRAKMSA